MTVHDLHDALNLLPGDLITATDRLRVSPKTTVIHWRRWVSLAAALALVVGTSLVFQRTILPGLGDAKLESAVEAPAAAAPMAPLPVEQEVAADEVQPEAPAAKAPAADAAGSSSVTGGENGLEEELCIDHSHRFAEESDRTVNSPNYCGNMMVTVTIKDREYAVSGSDAVTMTDILAWLNYDPDAVCRCMTEFIVDTEMLMGIQVNLTEGFARCDKGQAALTEKQVQIIREIIDRLP